MSGAMAMLDAEVPPGAGELAQRLDLARRELPDHRGRLEGMSAAVFEAHEIAARQNAFNSIDARTQREGARANAVAAQRALASARAEVQLAIGTYEIHAKASEIAGSLSALVEHGETLGLHDEHCPLCQLIEPKSNSLPALRARARIETLAAGINEARKALTDAKVREADREQAAAHEMALLAVYEAEERNLRDREAAHIQLLHGYGLDPSYASNPDRLESEVSIERDRLVEVERALNALEASRAVNLLSSVDAQVAILRRQVDAAADELARAQNAVTQAKSLEKSVLRSASEIVDERLASISPLLNELYQRLRPHVDWRSIDYSIRGDVRRFLSLKVGDDLNPQFVFSSGQRRAAGLAFLLSVHLARPWATWQSLLLDDPVQHIDDYRALHLVEVLSALRQAGRQVVIAVEDEALADLSNLP